MDLLDPLFTRLKARVASEQATLKQAAPARRSTSLLPRLEGHLAIESSCVSNTDLPERLEP